MWSLKTDPTESVTDQLLTGQDCDNKCATDWLLTKKLKLKLKLLRTGQQLRALPPNTVISDFSETEISLHFTGVARVGAADLHVPAALFWTCKQGTIFEKRLLLLLSNFTDGDSGVLRSRQYYIQSDWSSTGSCGSSQTAVAWQVVRRGLTIRVIVRPRLTTWQDGMLTDNQLDLDNGVEAFPLVHTPDLLHTQQLFLFSRCLEKLPHTLV